MCGNTYRVTGGKNNGTVSRYQHFHKNVVLGWVNNKGAIFSNGCMKNLGLQWVFFRVYSGCEKM